MFRRILVLVVLVLGPATAFAVEHKQQKLELRGQVWPPFRWMAVALHSSATPFSKQTITNTRGRFKFKKLAPGPYVLILFHPRWGEFRRSVQVTPSFADKKGRVETTIVYRRTREARERQLERRNMVSYRELSVSNKAKKEYIKADKRLREQKVEEAVAHLEKALDISPQFVAAWNRLGTIAYQERDFETAEMHFRKAIDLHPESFAPLVNLGGVLITLRRNREALQYNNYAVLMRPDDALANSQLGRTHFYLGNFEESERYLRKAKRIDPSHFSLPQRTLAEVYARQGKPDQAIQELQELIRRHPDSPIARIARQAIARVRQQSTVSRNTQDDLE